MRRDADDKYAKAARSGIEVSWTNIGRLVAALFIVALLSNLMLETNAPTEQSEDAKELTRTQRLLAHSSALREWVKSKATQVMDFSLRRHHGEDEEDIDDADLWSEDMKADDEAVDLEKLFITHDHRTHTTAVVTIARNDPVSLQQLRRFVGSVHFWHPELPVIVYGVGISHEDMGEEIEQWDNILLVTIKAQSAFTSAKNVIKHALYRYELALFIDSHYELTYRLDAVYEAVKEHGYYYGHSVSADRCVPAMFALMRDSQAMKKGWKAITFTGEPSVAGSIRSRSGFDCAESADPAVSIQTNTVSSEERVYLELAQNAKTLLLDAQSGQFVLTDSKDRTAIATFVLKKDNADEEPTLKDGDTITIHTLKDSYLSKPDSEHEDEAKKTLVQLVSGDKDAMKFQLHVVKKKSRKRKKKSTKLRHVQFCDADDDSKCISVDEEGQLHLLAHDEATLFSVVPSVNYAESIRKRNVGAVEVLKNAFSHTHASGHSHEHTHSHDHGRHKKGQPYKVAVLVPTRTPSSVSRASQHPLVSFFKEFAQTIDAKSTKVVYHLYVGYDDGDAYLDSPSALNKIKKQFDKALGDSPVTLHMSEHSGMQHSPVWVLNALADKAFHHGAHYFMVMHDNTHFESGGTGWAMKLIKQLKRNKKHKNLGVTGPHSKGLFDHAFVSRIHFQIFPSLFPRAFRNWWSEDWITRVYCPKHCFFNEDLKTKESDQYGQRYKTAWETEKHLADEVAVGKRSIANFLKKHK